jgi:citrate lyase subunit gamma (acyl carrier protein)
MRYEAAQAGTLESSDCLVTLAPSGDFSFEYRSGNGGLFAERTEAMVREILERYGTPCLRVQISDQGALEATLRARLEIALERALRKE